MPQTPKRTRQIIHSFEAKALKKRSLSIKLADLLTSYFGSIGFLVINVLFFVVWILINMGKVPGVAVFDPYPYVLLITAVSLEAIILAIVVLISQNRENQITTLREELQLQVELYAEHEISKVLKLLRELLKERGIKISDKELDDMINEVDTSYIERKLEEELSPKVDSIPTKVAKTVGKTLKK